MKMGLKDIKLGKSIDEIQEGDSLTVTEIIEDKDILLYLGLTNDGNPLYIQHDYSQTTRFHKPIVPTVLLVGILTSNVSKHLPGPGSHIVDVSLNVIEPIYHNSTITFNFEVERVDERREQVTISVVGTNMDNERVLDAELIVETPRKLIFDEEENVIMNERTEVEEAIDSGADSISMTADDSE
nr:MaoC/PaaZ C-terminal domain-containing protein [Trichococcus collinsii]